MNDQHTIQFTLTYKGHSSERSEIDLYDVSQALIGLQRSLALTTHLVLNSEIITQSPALKGAHIYALPPEEGSWKITAAIIVTASTAFYHLGTAPKDTPLGHLIYSAYDYVVSESLGVHVDFQKSLGQLYEEAQKNNQKIPELKQHQLDSLTEKCLPAIREIHRPIYKTNTAESASIIASLKSKILLVGKHFTLQTYEYMSLSEAGDEPDSINGRIASYNSNTFKGRIYVPEEGRPVPFELSEKCRTDQTIQLIVNSLRATAMKDYNNVQSTVYCSAFKNKSKSGLLKSYIILDVSPRNISQKI